MIYSEDTLRAVRVAPRQTHSIVFFRDNNQRISLVQRDNPVAIEEAVFAETIRSFSYFFGIIGNDQRRLFGASFLDGFLRSVPRNIRFFVVVEDDEEEEPVELGREDTIDIISILLSDNNGAIVVPTEGNEEAPAEPANE